MLSRCSPSPPLAAAKRGFRPTTSLFPSHQKTRTPTPPFSAACRVLDKSIKSSPTLQPNVSAFVSLQQESHRKILHPPIISRSLFCSYCRSFPLPSQAPSAAIKSLVRPTALIDVICQPFVQSLVSLETGIIPAHTREYNNTKAAHTDPRSDCAHLVPDLI